MGSEDNVTVFVSHHSSKVEVAKAVETALQKRGVKCWIAPRDVDPGEPFDKSVRNAIDSSAAILLLFCAKSEKSRHVKRELILGDTAGRPIIPLRLEAIDPGELAYHLADSQWIDWIDRRDSVIDRVASQAKSYAGQPDTTPPAPPPASTEAEPAAGVPAKIPGTWIALAAIALLAAVLITWMITSRGDEDREIATDESDAVEIADADLAEGIEDGDDVPEDAATPVVETPAAPPPQSQPSAPPPASSAPSPAPQPQAAPPTPAPAPTPAGPLQRVVQACAGVPSDTEYLICADSSLQDRAREMSGLIRQIRARLESSPDRLRNFNRAQRNWYNNVRATCHSAACVAAEQDRWNANLRSRMAEMR